MRSACQLSATVVLTTLLSLMVCTHVKADDGFSPQWTFDGFGTIGYTATDKYDDRIPRRNIYQSGINLRDNGFLMDSRLGFQIKGQLDDHWEVVGQIVAREQFSDSIEDHIDLAFARYRANNEWQVAIGRQAFDLFFLSDHRNTGYSYDWVRPPTEFYGFMPYDFFDGIKIAKEWGDFDNDWHWGVSVGNIKSKFDSDIIAQSGDVDKVAAKPIYGTELSWQTGHWQVRGNFAVFKFKQELGSHENYDEELAIVTPIWSDFAQIISDFNGSFTLRYGALGASWQRGDWKIQSEWSIIDTNFIGFNGQRAYFHVAKRWQDWQPFFTIGYAHDSQQNRYNRPRPGFGLEEFFEDVGDSLISMKHNQHSFSLGVRWDFSREKALKLQCDQFHFKAGSGSIHGRVDEKYRNDETRSWCSVAFDWVF